MTRHEAIGGRLTDMAGDQHDPQRATVREWFLAEQRRVDAISDSEWAARRDAEVRHIREQVAARRSSAA